jgi:hypothetical protein
MSAFASWTAANDRYLADALAGLRARLERLGAEDPGPQESGSREPASGPLPATEKGSSPSLFARLFGSRNREKEAVPRAALPSPEPAEKPKPLPPPDSSAPSGSGSPEEGRPALQLLTERLGLSPFERDILLLCAAMEFDTRTAALCARAQRNPARPFPTFELALTLFDFPSWDALSPERPLRYWRLLEISQPGAQPLVTSALRADERIVNYIKGVNYLDDRLAALLSRAASEPFALPPSQRAVADTLVRTIRSTPRSDAVPLLQLLGSDSGSKQIVAQVVAAELGLQIYCLAADLLPAAVPDQETLIRLWQRESLLLPLALFFGANDLDRGDVHIGSARRFLGRVGGLVFLDTREPWTDGLPAVSADVAKPTPKEQRAAWRSALGDTAMEQAERLAGHFDFGLSTIHRVAQAALAGNPTPQATASSLWDNALARARPSLDALAQRIEPKAAWNDIQLPAQEKALLRQIADQVALRSKVYDDWGFRARMNRGLAVSALFAGESGTGKTMAAEVIAQELGLLLYRIDLSAVVSKYIGETEKNLRRLFDTAENGGAILFFDEADALFGRRSEVKDSHDRYANIEVNYLLQRMESYRGLAILATNMKNALDAAFLRRLRFVVNFPFPGRPERKAIWASVFPAEARVTGLDLDRLARLPLSGGSIHGIALNAAFMAARDGHDVTMSLILEAAKNEFRKLEKPVNEADFRWLEPVGKADKP